MKNYTGITDKEKLHLMRQQLATQDRVIVELRKKRMSAVCRAKAFQKHLKDAKGKLKEMTECRDSWFRDSIKWKDSWEQERKAFVDETAAHAKTLRLADTYKQLLEDSLQHRNEASDRHSAFIAKADGWLKQWDEDIKRGDLWCFVALTMGICLIAGFIGVYVGLRG